MATAGESTAESVAYISGGSRGLGRALTVALTGAGWRVITDARDGGRLSTMREAVPEPHRVVAIAGDVADPGHRARVASAVAEAGGLDLVVNNASVLGPTPLPRLADYPLGALETVYAVNTFAPLALLQLLLPHLERRGGRIVNISSDAAAEAYEGWGGYGSSKAALDHLTAILAVEHPQLRVYSFDPGDMRTDMQQEAFPGEDISDRPSPESVVPALLHLVHADLPSGRYRAGDVADAAASS
jgi:NAD(P)-dependent dehydrogenase (short-subunit alcohol dehydrogenase family)